MGNSKGSDNKNYQESFKANQLRFLIDQHFKEVSHFWTRTNVFLVTNIAAFGAVLSNMYSENPIDMKAKVFISAMGFLFCVIWICVNRIAIYYEKRWLVDAKRLAGSDPSLKSIFYISLGFRERSISEEEKYDWFGDKYLDLKRPNGYSATKLMYIIISLFLLGWIVLLLETFLC